jgi:hypothetical protein
MIFALSIIHLLYSMSKEEVGAKEAEMWPWEIVVGGE